MIDAVLSHARPGVHYGKYAVCGACGRPLCRRDRVTDPDAARGYRHELVWDADWRIVGDHIERSESALDRLSRGNAPVRRGTVAGPDFRGPKQSLGFPNNPPALCPWAVCGALNRIDPKALDVD